MNILITIAIIVLIFIIWYISTSNKIKRLAIKVEESLSGIDVALTKRYDVLTKMIEVVKGYTKHEKEVLIEVIKLRNNMSVKEKSKANDSMDDAFEKINIVSENYPELKASENFKILQKSIVDVEEHLQAARRLYNSNVSAYNEILVTFPSNTISKAKGLVEKDYFQASETEKNNVKIDI